MKELTRNHQWDSFFEEFPEISVKVTQGRNVFEVTLGNEGVPRFRIPVLELVPSERMAAWYLRIGMEVQKYRDAQKGK